MIDPLVYILPSVLGGLALYVWVSLSLSAVFAKAGEEGWKAWVPVWNTIVLLQLGGMSGWLILIALVPGLGEIALFVILIVVYHRINASFGFGAGMTVLAALLFPVWTSVLGWGSARWIGAEPAGPVRRGDGPRPLDSRVGGLPAAGYGVPPRPPAPGFTPPAARFDPPAVWTQPNPGGPGPAGYAGGPGSAGAPGFAGAPGPAGAPPTAPPRPTAPATAPVGFVPVAGAGAAGPVTRPTPGAFPLPVDESFEATAPAGDRRTGEEAASPVPAFRSTARSAAAPAAAAAAEEEEPDDIALMLGRSHAPFTQTVPTSFTPPAESVAPAAPRRAFAPQPGATPGPVSSFAAAAAPDDAPASGDGPDAPVQSVPAGPEPVGTEEPWAPPRVASGPVSSIPARATRYSPPPDPDAPFETSAEVSAVVGAPTLGAPRSARESVSAQHGDREIPDVDAGFDETVIAARRRPAWVLTPPLGAPIAVTSDVVIVGRRPGFDGAHRNAQLVPVSDETRTMSKTHARLELRDDGWVIIDLESTNGVILLGENGRETEVAPGVPVALTERFLLGDAELRLSKKDADWPLDSDGE